MGEMMAYKISLIGQISEVQREIEMRRSVYQRRVADRKMKQAEAELLIERMEAVLATLLFVQEHEQDFRAYMQSRKAVA
jgi:hypothetical protein